MSIKDSAPLKLDTGRKPSKLSQALRAIQFEPASNPSIDSTQKYLKPGHIFSGDGFKIRVAATRHEREDAYCFVQKTYEQKGFSSSEEPPLRIKLQYALPATLTLLANDNDDNVIGTLTVVPDSDLGLPMSECFHADLERLRESGKRICEYTSLSVVGTSARLNRQILLNLFRAAWLYASEMLQVTDVCCVVNPRHESFYRKVFFYEPFGTLKSCAHVQGAPGVPLVQNVQTMKDCSSTMLQAGLGDLHDFFFGKEQIHILENLKKVKPRMPSQDFCYFFMQKTRLWQEASAKQQQCLLTAMSTPLVEHCV